MISVPRSLSRLEDTETWQEQHKRGNTMSWCLMLLNIHEIEVLVCISVSARNKLVLRLKHAMFYFQLRKQTLHINDKVALLRVSDDGAVCTYLASKSLFFTNV